MKLRLLRELSSVLKELKTTTFSAEEDLLFINFMEEVETIFKTSNDKIAQIIQKYNITLDDKGMPETGEVEKFKNVYELFMETDFAFENKFEFDTIRKLKNENSLNARVFKLMNDNFKKQ